MKLPNWMATAHHCNVATRTVCIFVTFMDFKFTLHGVCHFGRILSAGSAVKPTLMVMIMMMNATTNTCTFASLAFALIHTHTNANTEPFKYSFVSPRRLFDLRIKHFKIHGGRLFLLSIHLHSNGVAFKHLCLCHWKLVLYSAVFLRPNRPHCSNNFFSLLV